MSVSTAMEMPALARCVAAFSRDRLAAALPTALRLLGEHAADPKLIRAFAIELGFVEAAIVEKLVGPTSSIDEAYAAVRNARTPREEEVNLAELLRLQQREAIQMREFFLKHRLFDPIDARQVREQAQLLLEANADPASDDDAS